MRVHFLGVRGSTPAPGPEFVRYGGHTSCLAISRGAHHPPTLVLDAGTGLRRLTELLGSEPYDGTILLTHLHWDHVQGLPFFTAGDRPDARVVLGLPAQDGADAEALLATFMAPPAFPITAGELQGTWTFRTVDVGLVDVPEFDVRAVEVVHKGGRTFGYVVSDGAVRVAYLPDHAPALGLHDDVVHELADVDVLIHDAQMVASERRFADAYAHATIDDAIALAERVRARRLVLFHHSPGRTDDRLDDLVREFAASRSDGRGVEVSFASEGLILDVTR